MVDRLYIIMVSFTLLLGSNRVYMQVIAEVTESSNPPEIFLEKYKTLEPSTYHQVTDENAAPNLFIKEGDDFIIKDGQNISDILLTCRATYPIYWLMKSAKPMHLTATKTLSQTNFNFTNIADGNWTNLQPKEFISYLEVYNDASATGLYTCCSVENDTVTKSTYLFLPGVGEDAKTLMDAGGEQEVGLNGLDEVTVPCKTTKNNAEVSLLKETANGVWSPLKLKASYNPKQGFILEKGDVDSLLGKYKCTVGVPVEQLIVNVVEEFFDDRKFSFKNVTYGKATWKQSRHGAGVECYSNNSSVPPYLYISRCWNPPDCEMKKRAFINVLPKMSPKTSGLIPTSRKHKSLAYTTVYAFVSPFIMQCKGDGIDVSGQYATELDYPNVKRLKFVLSMSAENMTYNVETAIKISVKKWGNLTNSRRDFGPHFYDIDLEETDLHVGEKFVIDCCGMYYYHSIGRIQRIVWKNGTSSILSTPDKERYDPSRDAYGKDFCYTYIYEEENEEYLLTADENMSHFECIVPMWNERKPTLITIPLNIKVPSEPVFAAPEEVVNVSYNENQLGLLQLDCKLSAGAPPAHMVWTKDGYQLNQTDMFWSVVTEGTGPRKMGSNVLFMRAIKEIEGEYECFAENWMGSAQKRFFVTVHPRSYTDYWIALVLFGGFFAIIMCCAIRISTLEKETPPKKIKPVTFVPMDNGGTIAPKDEEEI